MLLLLRSIISDARYRWVCASGAAQPRRAAAAARALRWNLAWMNVGPSLAAMVVAALAAGVVRVALCPLRRFL